MPIEKLVACRALGRDRGRRRQSVSRLAVRQRVYKGKALGIDFLFCVLHLEDPSVTGRQEVLTRELHQSAPHLPDLHSPGAFCTAESVSYMM
jgi:hypothetical protein